MKIKLRTAVLTICFLTFLSVVHAQVSKAILSSRWIHPINKRDTLNTANIINVLKPARLDWLYCQNPEDLKILKAANLSFSLTINPEIADSGLYITTKKFRIVDIDGAPFVAPWMKGFKNNNLYWGCVNNPGFKDLFLQKSKQYIDWGAYAVFVDDPMFNAMLQRVSPNQYGCFCDYCINGFQKYMVSVGGNMNLSDAELKNKLKAYLNQKDPQNADAERAAILKNYQRYQEASVISFLTEWRDNIKKYKPGIKVLCNNYQGSWSSVYGVFDGGIAELTIENLNTQYLDSVFAVADRLKKSQLFTLISKNPDAQRYLIAYCFLKKRDYLIPWDLYVPDKENAEARYYTNVQELKKVLADFNAGKATVALGGIKSSPNSKDNKTWYNYSIDKLTHKQKYLLYNKP